jgi:hypothetical protein
LRSFIMAKKKEVHVTPHPEGGWQVRKGGASRASSRHATQREALESGRETAKREKTELVIHGKDGKIRDKDSYGHDPHPPKDRKH